jgi:hypothetical protein
METLEIIILIFQVNGIVRFGGLNCFLRPTLDGVQGPRFLGTNLDSLEAKIWTQKSQAPPIFKIYLVSFGFPSKMGCHVSLA